MALYLGLVFFPLVFVFSLAFGLFFETICILGACFRSVESFCFASDAQDKVVPILWLFLCGWQTQPQWRNAAREEYLLARAVCLLRGGKKAPACGTYKMKIENTMLG